MRWPKPSRRSTTSGGVSATRRSEERVWSAPGVCAQQDGGGSSGDPTPPKTVMTGRTRLRELDFRDALLMGECCAKLASPGARPGLRLRCPVPLSEDEQRILQEIEQNFYADDPSLADEIGSHSLFAHCLSQMKWAALVFLIGVAVLTVALATATSFLVAFAGFVVMLAAALWFERSLRKLGRAGMNQLSETLRHKGGVLNVLGFGDGPFPQGRPRRRDTDDEA